MLDQLRRIAVGPLMPDLTVILDVDLDTGLSRALARLSGETRFERLDRSFHERLREGFRMIAAAEPQRCLLVDANRTVAAIHQDIRHAVSERLGISA
jgi:dTMP kinase